MDVKLPPQRPESVTLVVSASYVTDQDDVAYEEKSDRAMMRHLPEEDRLKIQQQVRSNINRGSCLLTPFTHTLPHTRFSSRSCHYNYNHATVPT